MKYDVKNILKTAVETVRNEAAAIAGLESGLNENFSDAVQLIYENHGRVVITGVGKSAIIAMKIVATLNSTGTPSVFMHATDAIHGDLGVVQPNDIVICLSKSGNTPEIKVLVPLIKNMGNTLVAIVSQLDSYLAQQADYVIHAAVGNEACPNNLAPTTSTTVQLVVGDALAICLLKLRGFTAQDFARVHPGGSLGKKLYLHVSDLMNSKLKPQVNAGDAIPKSIIVISENRLGATAVFDNDGALVGIITDGDVRRMLGKWQQFDKLTAADIMTPAPITIDVDEMAIKAFNLMDENQISQLVVMKDGKYAGMVHVHDILREGIV
ncbi:MAG: KpsF/GutQ family sugar-phosphate isomerase [Prevotellaceae bacterium]|nr:KpsF/GutQ family sugar-phosphate isomerase [Prevotellaceae bacterium]